MGKLSDKIEQIRQQPEHIRLKYVWGSVALSMILIIFIWLMSVVAMFKGSPVEQNNDNIESLKAQLQNINQQAPSLKDMDNISEQVSGVKNEGIQSEGGQDDLQYPVKTEQSEIPQSSAYSEE